MPPSPFRNFPPSALSLSLNSHISPHPFHAYMTPLVISQLRSTQYSSLSLRCRRTMASVVDAPARPRRFAPLNHGSAQTPDGDAPGLQGIVFDVDGTLCLPQNYMFSQMRAALGIEKSTDILEHIRGLPTETERTEAVAKVQAIEREAMLLQQPQPGLVDLMDYLETKNIRRALCTRNFEAPVTHLLKNHLPNHIFEPIVTRDTPNLLPKPEPSGLLHIAEQWGLEDRAERMIMVGDSIDDMTAGHTAGAATVLLVNDRNRHLKEHVHTDLCISRLDDLIDILENGFVGDNCAGLGSK